MKGVPRGRLDSDPVPARKIPTRDRILDALRRSGPSTAAELARRFRLSAMAVRQHLGALSREGIVRADGERASRGRPARAYGLTPAARGCFPDRSGALALEILVEMERVSGRGAVVEALERRGRRVARAYRAAMGGAKGRAPADRLRILASLRDAEGYACDAERNGGRLPDLVERHCPIAPLAERWPEVCRIEEEVFGRALGLPVARKEHMLSGGRCCRYAVGEV